MKNNVLIITSAAAGRTGIAAVKREIEEHYKNHNVLVIDEEQYGDRFSAARRGRILALIKRKTPRIYGRFFSDRREAVPRAARHLSGKKLRGESRRIRNAILRFTPSVVLVTTPRLMMETVNAKRTSGFKCPVVGLCESYTFDRAFFNPRADSYIVENPDVKKQLTAMGYSAGRVFVLGFPIREELPDVDSVISKKERLGLNLNPAVFLSGGENGSRELLPVYDLLLDQGSAINVIVNCGRNETLYYTMLQKAQKRGAENVKIYLSSNEDVRDALAAADCLITIYDAPLIYRAFLTRIPVIAFAPKTAGERADLEYLSGKGLILLAPDRNRAVIDVCDIVQNNLGEKLATAASARTRPDGLGDIAAALTGFAALLTLAENRVDNEKHI